MCSRDATSLISLHAVVNKRTQLMLVYLFGGKVETRTTKLMSQIYILAVWPIQRFLLALNIRHSYYNSRHRSLVIQYLIMWKMVG